MSEKISFRLPDEQAKRLTATVRPGESVHDTARRLVWDALTGRNVDELIGELAETKAELIKLRQDIATAVAAILVTTTAGHKITQEEAETWVHEHLLSQ